MEVTSFCHQGERPEQEDRFSILSNFAGNKHLTLLTVADGHGGQAAAKMLIEAFPKQLASLITKCKHEKLTKFTTLMSQALAHCVEEWDRKCFGKQLESIKKHQDKEKFFASRDAKHWEQHELESGSTLCSVLIDMQERKFNILNLGDSRAAWLCNNDKLIGSTVDHSVPAVMKPIKDFPFTYGDGYIADDLAMCRSFGDNTLSLFRVISREPDVLCVKIGNGSARLVVASDGLFDWMSNHGALYDELKDAGAIARQISKFDDNITVLYAKIAGNGISEEGEELPACAASAPPPTKSTGKQRIRSPAKSKVLKSSSSSILEAACQPPKSPEVTEIKQAKKKTTVKKRTSTKNQTFEEMLNNLDLTDEPKQDDKTEDPPAKKKVTKKKKSKQKE